MNQSKSNRFFYKGKYFDSENEFFEYANQWGNLPADIDYWEGFLKDRLNEIKMNIAMTNGGFSNRSVAILFGLNLKD